MTEALKVFISYAHEDRAFKDTLRKHLAGLVRRKVMEVWADHHIDGGEDWKQAISKAMDDCDMALLLVSPDFLNSDFIHSEELSRLLARRERDRIRVVPIIVRPCRWQSEEIGRLQALPPDGRPIVSFPQDNGERDQAWTDIVVKLEDWAGDYRTRATPPPAEDVVARPPPEETPGAAIGRRGPGTVFRDPLLDGTQGPEMVVIPSGEFQMGERPAHRVQIPKPFALARYPATFDEYDRYAQAARRALPRDRGWGRGRQPVINVSWEDTLAYAEWLSKQTGKRYRLPTEAEWEYAARAGTTTAYWWGDEIGKNRANCDGCGSRWDDKQTSPVGSFAPNPWGLYDMLGNVWEWVQDCWHDRYEGAPGDGKAWETEGGGDCARRVVRGGSWFDSPTYVRSALRNWLAPADRTDVLGFRLAQDL
jgi:formylglycine-generating enzyme required for sulfatase activity